MYFHKPFYQKSGLLHANEIFGPENFYMQFHDKFARVNHPMKVEACDAEIDNQLYWQSTSVGLSAMAD